MLPPQYLPQPHHSLPQVRTELILGVLTPLILRLFHAAQCGVLFRAVPRVQALWHP